MPDSLKVAICEDTKADEEKIISIINKSSIPTECTLFESGEELLEAYRPQIFDLLLTDIYMDKISGIDAVTEIRKFDEDIPVAFVTTSTDHTLEGYRLSALKYIEKPIREKDILEILELAQMKKDNAPSLRLFRNGKEERIKYSRITYIEQHTHNMIIHMNNGSTEEIRGKLSHYVPELEVHNFFQPHKSFSVNMNYVCSIDSELKCFKMQDGRNIPIRRESMSSAKQALKDHLFMKTRGDRP